MKGFVARTRARLAKKLGPFPVWVWLVAAVGVYVWRRHKAASSPAGAAQEYSAGYTQGYGDASSLGAPSGGGGSSNGASGGGTRPAPKPRRKLRKPKPHRKPRHKGRAPAHAKPGRHPAPVGKLPHRVSGRRGAPEPIGRTTAERALPAATPREPSPRPNATPHAVPPASRPRAVFVPARHTIPAGGEHHGR